MFACFCVSLPQPYSNKTQTDAQTVFLGDDGKVTCALELPVQRGLWLQSRWGSRGGELMGVASPLMTSGNIPLQINGMVQPCSFTTNYHSDLWTQHKLRRGAAGLQHVPSFYLWILSKAFLKSKSLQKVLLLLHQKQHQQPSYNMCHRRVQWTMLHLCHGIFSILIVIMSAWHPDRSKRSETRTGRKMMLRFFETQASARGMRAAHTPESDMLNFNVDGTTNASSVVDVQQRTPGAPDEQL